MSNPIFNLMSGSRTAAPNIWNVFQEFTRSLRGNPQTLVQNLLSSGRMTQEQFKQFSQMADQILKK